MATWVGIDVGASAFLVGSRTDGVVSRAESFAQTAAGHRDAVKRIAKLAPERVVLEATGIYYLDLAVALATAGLPVSVINPRSYRHFAALKLKQSKTDGIDTALLSEYGECLKPPLWTPPAPHLLALRDIGRQINRLTASRTQAKNRLHAFRARIGTSEVLITDEEEGIAQLGKRIERLMQEAQRRITEHPGLVRKMDCLTAAKGIGQATAIALLAELLILPAQLKASQVVRYAGLDVRLCQSGTSINRPGRLSKAGNAYLRAALFLPAMSARRFDTRTRAFYDSLTGRGKKKMQAICAVMRKNLTGIWHCLKHDQNFDSTKLFSEIHTVKT